MKHPINGSKQWLLWVNTILTAGAAYIGGRLWDKLDHVHDRQLLMDKDLSSLVEKQAAISREHHAIFLHLDKLDKSLKP